MAGRVDHRVAGSPTVSVVIPTYNYRDYLPACLAGVCRQTVRELEVIVVDDGSTDGTEAVVRGAPDPRIRYIRTPHRGNYFARNRGIEESRGEFIAFLDADDAWIAPHKLRDQLEVFRRDPAVGICFSGEYAYKQGSGQTWRGEYGFRGSTKDQEEIWAVLCRVWSINTSTVVVRRSCLDAVGHFDTTYHNAMDVDLWCRILFRFDGYYDAQRLVIRRRHDRNHSLNPEGKSAVEYTFNKLVADEGATRRMTEAQRAEFLAQKERIKARTYSEVPRQRSVAALFSPPRLGFPLRIVRGARRRLRRRWRWLRFHREIDAVARTLSVLDAGPPPYCEAESAAWTK